LDYKILPPSVDKSQAHRYWDRFSAIMEMNVQSVICQPEQGSTITETPQGITVKGYAISGGGRKIERVGKYIINPFNLFFFGH